MIVADASTVLELLLQTKKSAKIEAKLLKSHAPIAAPSLIDVEVAHVLRRYWLKKELSAAQGQTAIEHLQALPLARYSHEFLLELIWKFRTNMTAYDAAYVALSYALKAPLITCDKKLAGSAKRYIEVQLV